jgi:hypothetical protein
MPSRCVCLLPLCLHAEVTPTQVAASNLRFGDGVTREVGMDLKNMKATKVGSVFSDVAQRRYDKCHRWPFSQIPTLPIFSL